MKGWDAMPEFYLIQWGVIGVFVLIHFLIGFLRGASKSTYFTIVSLVLTVVTLWLVSKISLNLLFSTFLSLETMIATIQNLSGGIIPAEFVEYILNPTISAVMIAVIDLVIKIVAFILIYPFLKWSLTMTIFRPIWIAFIKKPLLKKQNEKDLIAFQKKGKINRKFKKSKKLKKPIFGRLLGGFMGAIRGFVVGVVFLLPVIVLAGFVSGIATNLSYNEDHAFQLSSDADEMISIPSEYNEIIDNIIRMNENGIGRLTSQIIISGKSLDRIAFDMVFSADIIEEGEKVGEINLGNELEGIVGIAEVLISGGYLDNYDFTQISSENLPDIEMIMGHLGRSTLIQSMIPLGTRFAVINLLPPFINGTNLYDRESTKTALDNFTSIDWEVEFNNIYGIIEAMLEFGSYQELMAYADNPLLLLEMTPDEAEAFTDIIRAFGNLETLYLLNAGIDFATSYESVQNIVSWVNQENREAYLQERLSFILDHPDFFVGNSGEITRIANFIESIFADEDVSVKALYDSMGNLEDFIALQNPTWVGGLLDQLVQIELLVKTIPLALDYSLYEAFGSQIAADLADQISQALSETAWDEEILNVGNIYKEVLTIGIEAIFGENPDYFAFIDDIAVNHMDSIRTIVEYIFDDSEVVNVAVEIASPFLIEQFISDQTLRDLVTQGLMSDPDSGVVDFSFGQEINNILTMVETVYLFTTTEELTNIMNLELIDQLDFVSRFGSLTPVQFSRFDTAIKDMQLLSRLGNSALDYIQSTQNIEQLFIPTEVSLNNDLSSLINFVYYAANYLYTESLTTPFIEDVDFAPLLADPLFRSYLLPTMTNHSDFLISNIAHNIKLFSSNASLQNYLTIPDALLTASPEDQIWKDEIANLLGAVFDLGAFFENSNALTLSVREVLQLSEDPYQAPIELITQFADSDMSKARLAFGNLDASEIFRYSISTVIESLGTQSLGFIEGFELGMPSIALDNGVIKEDMFVELIWGISTLLDDANQTLGFDVVADLINNQDNYLYIQALNNISDDTYLIFSSITLLRGLISEILLDPSVQAYARDLVNNTGFVTVSDQFLAFERPDNLLDPTDLAGLFISAKSLQITAPFYYNPGQEIYGFINQLSSAQLDGFFDATLIKEIFTFALTDDLVIESLATRVNDIYYNAQAGIGLLAQINPDFTNFIASLGAQRDEDDYFDVGEFKALIQAFQELEVTSVADLSALADLTFVNQKITNSLVIEKLFESNWLYQNLNYVFTNEDLYNQLADILEQQILNQTGVTHELTGENVSFVLPKYDMLETSGDRVGMIKVSEFKKFLVAGTRVNWAGVELGSGAGIATNISNFLLEEGEDGIRHVDVLVDSNLMVAIFDKLLNFEYNGFGIDQILVDFGNSRLGGIAALDGLTLTKEILHYDTSAYDDNEVIKREEIAQLFESLTVLDLNQPINLQAFITLVDEGKLPDLLKSKILHSFVSNALTSEVVQEFGVTKVNGIQTILVLPNDFFAVDPVLLDGDLFKVNELENIFIALRALGLEDGNFGAINQDTFIALVDPATKDDEGFDDFDRVFGANYIYILLDRAIALEGFSDFAVQTLGLDALSGDPISLNPPQTIKLNDPMNPLENGRLPKIEFRRLLTSVNMLGDLDQVSDPDVIIDVLTGMIGTDVDPDTSEDEFDRFMSSDYLYYVISVLLQNQEEISVPIQALEVGGMYDGFIKRSEIRAVINALTILEIVSPGELHPEDITVQKLNDIVNQDESFMVQYLLSQAIIDALDPDQLGLIPSVAFLDGDTDSGLLTYDEIRNITQTLVDLSDSVFDEDNEEGYENSGDIPLMNLIDLLSDPTVRQVEIISATESIILKHELTKQILENLEYEAEDVYQDMFDTSYVGYSIFTQTELNEISLTLRALAEDVKEVGEDAGDIKLTVLVDLLSEPNVGQVEIIGQTSSLILRTELTKQLLLNLNYDADDLDSSLFEEGDAQTGILINSEIEAIVDTLVGLANNAFDPDDEDDDYESASDIELTVLVDILSDPNVSQVEIVSATDSSILKMEITKQLLENLEYEALDLMPNIFEGNDPSSGMFTADELTNISTTLRALAEDVKEVGQDAGTIKINVLIDLLSDPTVGQIQIIGDTQSLILKTELTKQLMTQLDYETADLDASIFEYQSATVQMFTDDEIDSIVSTLVGLANNVFDPDDEDDDYESASDIELTTLVDLLADPSILQVEIIAATDSYVLKLELTKQLLVNLDYEAHELPLEAFENHDRTKPFTKNELVSMSAALKAIANDPSDPVSSINPEEINVSQVVNLKTAQDPTLTYYALDSFVIQLLISEQAIPIVGADTIPEDGYFNVDETILKKAVIIDIIDAIDIMAGPDKTKLITAINPEEITIGQVEELHAMNRPIVNNLLNREIISALTQGTDEIPDEGYENGDPTTNKLDATEMAEIILALSKLGDSDTLIIDINFEEITVQQVEDVSTTKSVTIKSRITEQVLVNLDYVRTDIPDDAYEGGDNTKWFTESQIISIAASLKAITYPDNPENKKLIEINPNTITVEQMTQLRDSKDPTNSYDGIDAYIIQMLISREAIPVLGVDNIPDESYADQPTNTRLTKASIIEIIGAIDIVAGPDKSILITAVDFDLITIGQVQEIHDLDGVLTNRLISNTIVDAVDPDEEGNIPNEAFIGSDPQNNLERDEVQKLIESLRILSGKKDGDTNDATDDMLVPTVDSNTITIGQIDLMNGLHSIIMDKIISDAIIESIGEDKVPLSAYEDDDVTKNLKPEEVIDMIKALRILAGQKDGDPNSMTDDIAVVGLPIDPTIGQVKLLNALENSRITEKLISDSIIEAVGVGSVPIDAYRDDTPGNLLKQGEVNHMIEALEILGDDGDPETDTDDVVLSDLFNEGANIRIKVTQAEDLDDNESVIIKQIMSDQIRDMLTSDQIPLASYRTEPSLDRLIDSEISAMINSLTILAGGAEYIDQIFFDESSFTVTTLKSFPSNSLILNRIISSGLITNMPNIPIESYVERDPLDEEYKLDLLRIEINNILDALTILGIDDPNDGDSIPAEDITFAQLDEIVLLGTVGSLNEHPEGYSPIIVHILSTPMREAVSRVVGGFDYGVPIAARRNEIDALTYDLIYEEVVGLIDALKLIGNVGEDPGQEDPETTSLFDVSSTLAPESFGPDLLEDLIALDKLVVYRMISLGIQDADIDNDDSYALVGDRNFDDDLPGVPVYRDIKIDEMEHIALSMNLLGLTSIADIEGYITNLANLKALTPEVVNQLVESDTNGPNTIIYYIISETVDPDNDLFDTLVILDPINYPGPADNYYEIDVVRIRLKRTSISGAINALP